LRKSVCVAAAGGVYPYHIVNYTTYSTKILISFERKYKDSRKLLRVTEPTRGLETRSKSCIYVLTAAVPTLQFLEKSRYTS
jgi:hypothetical protein